VKLKFPATREQVREAGYIFKHARLCKRCHRNIEFYLTPANHIAPLEAIVSAEDGKWFMESHFATCPFANEFRKPSPAGDQGDLFGGGKPR
jgi:hypothetical protein